MPIIKELSFHDFEDEFRGYNRENQFTRKGLKALYDLIEELSYSTAEPYHLDVIGLCCDFTEYESIEQALTEYGLEDFDELEEKTQAIPLDYGGVLIQNF